ncbi:helix-turn-helix transcriptional regulator [Nocardia vulneris]|uniref:HTH araC/xylS-type domain-containing protein n=1 Tax=Nocardia vulneris TaxID=1141657 RepID=A0ABR4ZKM0_9NOCA|nr:AraC family transcriptional regulator [Nocardia vulneris]KIA65906.1 hypothetical protein FG87_05495 [Nocardia vulneris]
METTWAGTWSIAPDRLVLAGRFGTTSAHHHPAVQITLAVQGELIATGAGETVRCRGVIVPSGVSHALQSGGADTRVLSIYLHPASRDAREIAARVPNGTGPNDWAAAAAPLTSVDVEGCADLDAAAERLLATVRGEPVAADGVHPKLRDALDLLTVLMPRKLYLRDLAEAVSISQRSLGQLFVNETGVNFPGVVRWARLQYALIETLAGRNITDAAHSAGFSDSAHATRVCREMTGVPPSVLLRAVHSGSEPH